MTFDFTDVGRSGLFGPDRNITVPNGQIWWVYAFQWYGVKTGGSYTNLVVKLRSLGVGGRSFIQATHQLRGTSSFTQYCVLPYPIPLTGGMQVALGVENEDCDSASANFFYYKFD